ncbi:hypothetical protein OUI_0055 [Helicobacter pylori R036d]|uniref:Uncharacterized protein n=1 Tax=Helicobacter pylori R036d TaxID=1145113 RepID=K2KMG0_HELPX|nr:hypothetical protein OUI_0055 [Helicobacter pylori R036d]
MEDDIEKWEHNVRLLERMLEIYSTQAKASVDLVNQAWEGVKKRLHFYTDKHQEFIRRLKQASDAIDNEYNFPTPGVLWNTILNDLLSLITLKKAFLMND